VATYYCQVDIDNLQKFTHLQDDENFINQLINNDPFISAQALQYASKRIKCLDYIVENACLHDGQSLLYAHPKYYRDEHMVSIAFGTANRINNQDWKEVDKSISLNKEFVFELVSVNRNLYKELDVSLQNNSKFIKQVLEKHTGYRMLPDNQKRKISCMKLAASKSGLCIEHFPKDILNDAQTMNIFLSKHPGAIKWCGESLKSSLSTADMVCNHSLTPHPYGFFNESIRANKEIALMSLMHQSECSEHLPESLRNDEIFLKLLLSKNIDIKILKDYSQSIRSNAFLMKEICVQHPSAVQYIEDSLRYSSEFVQVVVDALPETRKSSPAAYNNFLNLKKIFKEFNFKELDLEIFEIFVEKIKQMGFEKELSFYLASLFKDLPEQNKQPHLCSDNAVDNFNSLLLEFKLSQSLSEKDKKIKIKI